MVESNKPKEFLKKGSKDPDKNLQIIKELGCEEVAGKS
jgi:hypothetical protein